MQPLKIKLKLKRISQKMFPESREQRLHFTVFMQQFYDTWKTLLPTTQVDVICCRYSVKYEVNLL